MAEPTDGASRYLRAVRGDRLRPHRLHSRYHVLRQLAAALQELVDALPVGDTVLDFGCADSPYEPLFVRKFTHYLRADLAGNPRSDVLIDTHGNLPLADASCDVVLSSQVLEHVADPRAYLAEAHRVLRAKGRLLLSTHGAWPYHPDPIDYWRWTRAGLEHELTRAGFETLEVRGVLGRTATALQLLQDAIGAPLPAPLRNLVSMVVQPVIGQIERRRDDPAPPDAAVYVVLARPRSGG